MMQKIGNTIWFTNLNCCYLFIHFCVFKMKKVWSMRIMDVISVNFKGKIYLKLIYEQATVNCDFKLYWWTWIYTEDFKLFQNSLHCLVSDSGQGVTSPAEAGTMTSDHGPMWHLVVFIAQELLWNIFYSSQTNKYLASQFVF